MSSFSLLRSTGVVVALAFLALGCNQGDERLEEKARIEGKAQAQTELQAQIDNIEKRVEIAKAEGKAQAQAELQAQIENIELLTQKARAEGRAQAEASINAQNGNLTTKSSEMEADLATRQLFYQAVHGTYEGSLATEAGEYKVRITLVPSLPPYTTGRVRQLEEITSDLTNLYFHAQVVQWNPANRLSAVGCRVENIKPDVKKGEISIASASCPNLYALRISDPELLRASTEAAARVENPYESSSEAKPASSAEIAVSVARSITEGKVSALPQIVGEVYPSTNASVYKLTVNRTTLK